MNRKRYECARCSCRIVNKTIKDMALSYFQVYKLGWNIYIPRYRKSFVEGFLIEKKIFRIDEDNRDLWL